MFTLLHWFLNENFISDLVSLTVDIVFQMKTSSQKGPLQSYVDFNFIVMTGIIVFIKFLLILIFMFKFGKPSSSKFFLFDGIHPQRVKLYFLHMIAYWVVLALIVFLTPLVNLKIRVLLLAALQLASLFLHVKRMYSTWLLYFQIFTFRELTLTFDVLIMVFSVFKNSWDPILGLLAGGVNIIMVFFFLVTQIVAAIYNLKCL